MLKKVKIILLFLVVVSTVNAQLNTFNLSDYIQPDYYRKISLIQPNFNFRSRSQEYSRGVTSLEKLNTSSLNYLLNINHYSRKRQSTISLFLDSDFIDTKYTSFRRQSYRHSHSISLDHKKFMTENAFFVGLDLKHSGDIIYSFYKGRNLDFRSDYKEFDLNLSNDLAFKIGKGRVENVNVAWHATRILEAICEHSSLDQNAITDEQVEAFANKMADIRNIRRTDARLEFSKEIEVLFNYLKSLDLIKEDNYTLFTKVLDAYQFESFVDRKKGSDLYIGVGINHDYDVRHINEIDTTKTLDDYEYKNLDTYFQRHITLGYNYYKPINQDWQLSFENNFDFGNFKILEYFNNSDHPNPPREMRSEVLSGLLVNTVNLDFLMNRRTNISFEYSSILDYQNDQTIEMDNVKLLHTTLFSTFLQYYISPRHTVNLDLTYSHEKERKYYIDSKIRATSVNLRTNYFFN